MQTNDATGCGTVIRLQSIRLVIAHVSTNIFLYIVSLHCLDFLEVAFNSVYKEKVISW